MVVRTCSHVATWAVATMILMAPVVAGAEQSSTCERRSALRSSAKVKSQNSTRLRTPHQPKEDTWSRVHLSDPIAKTAALEALKEAATWLADPRCVEVLTDLTDHEGHTLFENLGHLGMDAQTYLRTVVFLEETSLRSCRGGILARTMPESRIVWLCSGELKGAWALDRGHTVAAFIHEMLHTLGLGENPPSSRQITQQVLRRCFVK